jgi:hypothetical protein
MVRRPRIARTGQLVPPLGVSVADRRIASRQMTPRFNSPVVLIWIVLGTGGGDRMAILPWRAAFARQDCGTGLSISPPWRLIEFSQPSGFARFCVAGLHSRGDGISAADPTGNPVRKCRLADPANHEGLLVRRRRFFHGHTIGLASGSSRRMFLPQTRPEGHSCDGGRQRRRVRRLGLLNLLFCFQSRKTDPGCGLPWRLRSKPRYCSLCSSFRVKSAKAS